MGSCRAGALLLVAMGGSACGESTLIATEALPADAVLKVLVWTDGRTPRAELRRAEDASRITIAEAQEGERTVSLSVLPITRAALDAAVPGAVGVPLDEVVAMLRAEPGAALVVPGDEAVLEASVAPGADAVSYAPVPRATWDAEVASGRRPAIGLVVEDALACRVVLPLELFALPPSARPTAIAAVDASRALVSARDDATPFALLDVRADGRVLPVETSTRPASQQMDWDAATETLWNLDVTQRLHRLTADGDDVPFPPTPLPRHQVLSAGRDGTVVGIGRVMGDRIPTSIFDPRTQTWTTHRETANVLVFHLRTYDRRRILADVNCQTGTWRGTAWAVSGSMSNCTRPRDIALDGSQYLWLGNDGTLRFSVDEDGAVWTERPHAVPLTRDNVWPRVLAPMEEGRLVVAGDGGTIGVWIGDRWCVPEPVLTARLDLGAGAPGAAWLTGEAAQAVVRVRLRD